METKKCSVCKRELGIDSFGRDKHRGDGLNVRCKSCICEKSKASYVRTLEASRRRKSAYNARNAKALKEYQARWYQDNKEGHDAAVIERRKRNPEKWVEYQRQWEREHPESAKIRRRRYQQAHPDVIQRHNALRRFRIGEARVGEVSYERIWERDNGICHICGGVVERSEVHFDHIVPISKGGLHCEENIAVSHAICNVRKGARLVEPAERVDGRAVRAVEHRGAKQP